MGVGLNLTCNTRAEIGEIKEKLIKDLDSASIKYSIPFDKINKQGIKETIITMREPDIEISVENDIITYIKTGNTEFSNLDNIPDININILDHIKNIQKKVDEKFKIEGSTIKIEKLDTKTMNITLLVLSDNAKARIQILRDSFGDVFINTIRKL